MLARAKLVAFAATSDAQTAKHFYQDILGLPLLEDSPFALAFDAHGTQLRVQKVEKVIVLGYTVLGWQVNDIAAMVGQLKDKGVVFEVFSGLDQNEMGIWQSPSGAKVAWFKDPAGHVLSLTEMLDDANG